jgi:hypothetical protein
MDTAERITPAHSFSAVDWSNDVTIFSTMTGATVEDTVKMQRGLLVWIYEQREKYRITAETPDEVSTALAREMHFGLAFKCAELADTKLQAAMLAMFASGYIAKRNKDRDRIAALNLLMEALLHKADADNR